MYKHACPTIVKIYNTMRHGDTDLTTKYVMLKDFIEIM